VFIKRNRVFEDDLTRSRCILDVAWSPKHTELVAAAYSRSKDDVNSTGLVIVWNMRMPQRPEYVLKASTDITSVSFSPFHPHFIVGSTRIGQVLVWDLRQPVASQGQPTLVSPCTCVGHSHAVSGLKIVGTPNANSIISTSTDGTLCAWQMDMLAQPLETLELTFHAVSLTDELAITCLAFAETDTSVLWVGTEEGGIYQVFRNDRAGSKAGVNKFALYRHHTGMVTGLDFHPVHGSKTFGDLFLTSSVDWTVQLWRAKVRIHLSFKKTNWETSH
jgi:dynein intermediate chain